MDKKPNLLCIEDENFIGELYTRALTHAGYDVKVIADGEAALAESLTNAYDIILLDIMLPSMSGVEILRRLKDQSQTPPLKAKIIITTNLDQEESTREKIEKMADGYLVKAEITPRELVAYLQQIKL
ncbi:response regulator [bacterium]|nr:response regulator [bacterium]NBX97929.1 response regulator [bacterium]NDC94321.1 response regulator [bacterium]NDD82779.1 response regulator [bacterium]NDG28827.1 response regulator [bacterium]